MKKFTTYQYKANNDGSYHELAAYLVLTGANIAFFPGKKIINVTPTEDHPDVINEVGEYIDKEELSFIILPIEIEDSDFNRLIEDETTDPDTLREIIKANKLHHEEVVKSMMTRLQVCEKNLHESERSRDNYNKWWLESTSRYNHVKAKVQAISVLLGSIYSDENHQ